jgi:hypothetical protein
MLRCAKHPCHDAIMLDVQVTIAEVLTSARMAAGMTSRARRPNAFISAG